MYLIFRNFHNTRSTYFSSPYIHVLYRLGTRIYSRVLEFHRDENEFDHREKKKVTVTTFLLTSLSQFSEHLWRGYQAFGGLLNFPAQCEKTNKR